jgi:predicted HTH transcriptional regulator
MEEVNFYNTIHLTGGDLKDGQQQAQTQAQKIFEFMQEHSTEKFTSCEIRKNLIQNGKISDRTQESTIRARLTDLSKKGYITKLAELKKGFYGKPNHIWTIRTA